MGEDEQNEKSNFSPPKVYNFSLSEEFADSCLSWSLETFKVENPSFAILLDHALGVIWHIFAHNGREMIALNRVDVAWTMKFLEAIDLTNVGDTTDLDALKTYMRKLLISRYSFDNDTDDGTTLESTTADEDVNDSTTFSSLYEYLNFSEVIDEMRRVKSEDNDKKRICTDEQILERLRSLNPSIKTLDDVSKLIIPELEREPN